jgi:hypothetical protein
MEEQLLFSEIPQVVIASNTFICPIVIRYKDIPMLEMIREIKIFTTRIPIFHQDGTKLAVAKGAQLYETEEGKKAGVKMRHLPDCTVCEMQGKPLFEIRRQGAAALKINAELFTSDGAFLKWSDERISGLINSKGNVLQIGGSSLSNCFFRGNVGIQIGKPIQPMGAALMIGLPDEMMQYAKKVD